MKLFTALTLTLALLTEARSVDDQVTGSIRGLQKSGKAPKAPKASKASKASKAPKSPKCSKGSKGMNFNRIATFPICTQIDPTCNTDTKTVAEIVSVSDDGMTLVYTDSAELNIGFVDITDPSKPLAAGTVKVSGEPTSVAVLGDFALAGINTSADFVNTSGELVAIDINTKTIAKTWALGGQPDSVAVSPDGKYVVIAIENERNEDLGDGEPPQVSSIVFPPLVIAYFIVCSINSDGRINLSFSQTHRCQQDMLWLLKPQRN
jgi:hypothetical protein